MRDALQPFQVPMPARDKSDPPLLDYLSPKTNRTFNIVFEVYISSEKMRASKIKPLLICKGNFVEMYWTFDQMVAHHTVTGCNLQTGDLLGSGTISGPSKDSLGCLLERVALKMEPIHLPDGTSRQFLEDGDEIILRGYAKKENYPRIGFGECRGKVLKNKN
jgi:fumarylacetoacetase